MKRSRSITIKDSVIIGARTPNGLNDKNTYELTLEEARQGIELLRQIKAVKREDEMMRTNQNTGNLPSIKMDLAELIAEEFKNIKEGISKIDDKIEEVSVSVKPGITEELVLSKGLEIGGSGLQIVTTIPIKEIQYPELSEDIKKIREKTTVLSKLPERLTKKVKDYILKSLK